MPEKRREESFPVFGEKMQISGWSRCPTIEARVFSCFSYEDVKACLSEEGSMIVHALGRSYGDCSLAPRVIHTPPMSRIIDFDRQKGVVRCQAGLSIAELVETILPHGWFPAVTPGTSHVTIGGAIASDVHGKNHHVAGSFSTYVESIELMTADGRVCRCSPRENSDLFRATCGGMGLTGVIVAATLRLKRVKSGQIITERVRARNLEEACEQFELLSDWTYLVAWVDCFPADGEPGRCLLLMGEHANEEGLIGNTKMKSPQCPSFLSRFLNPFSGRLFNSLYYGLSGRTFAGRRKRVSLFSFFYPLDRLAGWNRLYGKAGPIQYQFVMPTEACPQGLYAVLKKSLESGHIPLLGVLKLFGSANSNLLSFPMKGYTLALDFMVRPGLFKLLDELDRIVVDHGGRIYLAKDARMPAEMLEAGYPGLARFCQIRKQNGLQQRFMSLQSIRLGL